jgi:hypothetical protein
MWQPGKSTILQVLISIQSMIFVQNPIENAPIDSGGESDNQEYNLMTQGQTVRYAMLDWLSRDDMRSGIWRDVIRTYFSFQREVIIAGVKRWATSNNQILRYVDWREGPFMFMWLKSNGRSENPRNEPAQDLLKQLIKALHTGNYKNF